MISMHQLLHHKENIQTGQNLLLSRPYTQYKLLVFADPFPDAVGASVSFRSNS